MPKNFQFENFDGTACYFGSLKIVNLIIWLGGLRKILDMSIPVLKVKDFPLGNLSPTILGSFDFMMQNSKSLFSFFIFRSFI